MLSSLALTKQEQTIAKALTTGPLDLIMKPLWHFAWGGDQFVRMMTNHHFLSQGFSPSEAADLTALFHADYAAVPAGTRRATAMIFFTFSLSRLGWSCMLDLLRNRILMIQT